MIKIETLINNQSVEKEVNSLRNAISKGKRSNLKVRNDVLRYFSDFIATRGPFKEANKNVFEKSSAAPDMQGSLRDFMNFFNTEFTKSTGASAEVYAEIKQRISSKTSTTITGSQLDEATLEAFYKRFIEASTNNRAAYRIKSGELKDFIAKNTALNNSLLQTINEKLPNIVYVNYLDKRHNNKPSVYVIKNAASILKLDSINSPSLNIAARPVEATSGKINIQVQVRLSATGEKLLQKNSLDVTNSFHASLGKNVSARFIKYAIAKFATRRNQENFSEFITNVITLANEFAEGSKTPIEFETQLNSKKTSVTQRISLPIPKMNKSQKFISSIQWTMLTQVRLGETMNTSEPAKPPNLSERSGRFRKSVQVFANYRSRILRFVYNPLYKYNIRYGYNPDRQITIAIREEAKRMFSQEFNIIGG